MILFLCAFCTFVCLSFFITYFFFNDLIKLTSYICFAPFGYILLIYQYYDNDNFNNNGF